MSPPSSTRPWPARLPSAPHRPPSVRPRAAHLPRGARTAHRTSARSPAAHLPRGVRPAHRTSARPGAAARPRDRHTRAPLGVVDLEARPGPAAARRHRGLALLWSLRHYASPSNDERPGPQPHKQTLNNVRTRPVVQCLPMGRCAYPRLGLLVWAVHPNRRHYTPSDRVQRHVTGAAPPPPTGTAARPRRPRGGLQSVGLAVCALPALAL